MNDPARAAALSPGASTLLKETGGMGGGAGGGMGPHGPGQGPGAGGPGEPARGARPSEPAFNVPGVILAAIAVLTAIHLGRGWLSDDADIALILRAAFIPARYEEIAVWPGGYGSAAWTFLSHALLHGNGLHLATNAIWLAAFGTAIARRFGTLRFLAFSVACAIGGALLHLATHWGEWIPMVGASGAISGHMAGAARFAFSAGGPLSRFATRDVAAYRRPALPLGIVLRDVRVLAFLGAWFAINLVFGAGLIDPGLDEGTSVAWQAHIGGFLAGLLLFPLIDPVRRR